MFENIYSPAEFRFQIALRLGLTPQFLATAPRTVGNRARSTVTGGLCIAGDKSLVARHRTVQNALNTAAREAGLATATETRYYNGELGQRADQIAINTNPHSSQRSVHQATSMNRDDITVYGAGKRGVDLKIDVTVTDPFTLSNRQNRQRRCQGGAMGRNASCTQLHRNYFRHNPLETAMP